MLSSGNGRQSMHINGHNPQAPYGSRSTGLVKSQLKMGVHPTGSDNLNKSSDLIKIRATDKVLYEVSQNLCSYFFITWLFVFCNVFMS